MTIAGYERLEVEGASGLVLQAAAEWMDTVLRAGLTFYGWAERQPEAPTLVGRGAVYSVDAAAEGPDARSRWAVRHYRRGGAIAAYLDDRYLAGGVTRPERELTASCAARERGVRTPAVVAAAWYRSGIFYRADLVTELVPDTSTLADTLFAAERGDEASQHLTAAGRLARELGERGIRHADLNAMNILVRSDASDAPFVIDLDRARVVDPPEQRHGEEMRRRLARSLEKIGAACARPLRDHEWAAFETGFAART